MNDESRKNFIIARYSTLEEVVKVEVKFTGRKCIQVFVFTSNNQYDDLLFDKLLDIEEYLYVCIEDYYFDIHYLHNAKGYNEVAANLSGLSPTYE